MSGMREAVNTGFIPKKLRQVQMSSSESWWLAKDGELDQYAPNYTARFSREVVARNPELRQSVKATSARSAA